MGYYSGFDEDSPGPEHAVWGMMPNLLQSPILSSLTTSRTRQVITTTIRSSWCLKCLTHMSELVPGSQHATKKMRLQLWQKQCILFGEEIQEIQNPKSYIRAANADSRIWRRLRSTWDSNYDEGNAFFHACVVRINVDPLTMKDLLWLTIYQPLKS